MQMCACACHLLALLTLESLEWRPYVPSDVSKSLPGYTASNPRRYFSPILNLSLSQKAHRTDNN
jgi:hypothetical protein